MCGRVGQSEITYSMFLNLLHCQFICELFENNVANLKGRKYMDKVTCI